MGRFIIIMIKFIGAFIVCFVEVIFCGRYKKRYDRSI